MSLYAMAGAGEVPLPPNASDISVQYNTLSQGLTLRIETGMEAPKLKNDKIVSTVDLPGSTMIVYELNQAFSHLTLGAVVIDTERGQQIEASYFKPVGVGRSRVFAKSFPAN